MQVVLASKFPPDLEDNGFTFLLDAIVRLLIGCVLIC